MKKRGKAGHPPRRENHPSREECLELLRRHGQPQTVFAHSLLVEKTAVALAKKIAEAGEQVELGLVSAGALLHDVAKMEIVKGVLKPRRQHAAAGARILEKEGFPAIARVVELHTLDAGKQPRSWEEKIVFYADKRIEWDRLVSLAERFEALKKRYANIPGAVEKIAASLPFTRKLEREIFSKIRRRPEELEKIISEE